MIAHDIIHATEAMPSMPSLLVRNVDPAVITRLKARARSSGRSLQGELRALVARADALTIAETRTLSEKWVLRLAGGKRQTDSAALIREDRGWR